MSDSFLRSSADDPAESRPARILLVEDNPVDVRLTREMLRESKVRNDLLVAHTAEEAEEILIEWSSTASVLLMHRPVHPSWKAHRGIGPTPCRFF